MPNPLAPDVERETPQDADPELLAMAAEALSMRIAGALGPHDEIELVGKVGNRAAYIRTRVGPRQRPHEMELFVREVPGAGFEGALGVLVDYLDGVLEEWAASGREGTLPLDYEGRPYELEDGGTISVYVRGEVRDLEAEAGATQWLTRNGQGHDEDEGQG